MTIMQRIPGVRFEHRIADLTERHAIDGAWCWCAPETTMVDEERGGVVAVVVHIQRAMRLPSVSV